MHTIRRTDNETIAAISTGMSGGIGIIRISGPDAVSVGDAVYKGRSGKLLSEVPTHTIHYGHIYQNGKRIDEVLACVMRAPHTYTGEDVVELNCHGGIFVLRKVLEYVLESGAVPAEPGEFTKRAFLNGRIDLSQAEAVMDIINSDSSYALESSVNQLKGSIRDMAEGFRSGILYETAYIESALDDPENYELTGFGPRLKEKILDICAKLKKTEDTFEDGRIIKDGIDTVILGRPNVGKSTLLNTLSGFERAIVSEIPGTTRDTLDEKISIGNIALRITDTAGLRETKDTIEKIGVEKAREAADKADLILYVADAAEGLDDEDRQILEELKDKRTILIYNKSDLLDNSPGLSGKGDDPSGDPENNREGIYISAKQGNNVEELTNRIQEMFFKGEISFNDQVIITNARHKRLLKAARESLENVIQSIDGGLPEDFYTIDLMDAYAYLGEITGADIGEDLVNEIFEKFCMGK